jgi:AcrR family transcriptional regulator
MEGEMVGTDDSTPVRQRTPRGQGRTKLVGAAGQLFAEHGISGTSLQSIADRLGVTKAAVYHQFASKDEIALAVAEPVIERLRLIADAAETLPDAEARRSTIEGLVDLALDQRGTAALLRRDPTMAQILGTHPPYLQQIRRIDALLLGLSPSSQRRIALAFAGGGIMTVGALPGLDGSAGEVRDGLIAAMSRALDTND